MKIRRDKLDALFSEFIRKRAFYSVHGCEYCGKPVSRWQDLQCSHFHSRRKRSTRYDPDNACGACFSCHQYLGENPYQHTEFFKKRLGSKKFEELNIRAEMIFPKLDKGKIEEELRAKIKFLEQSKGELGI